MTEQHDNPLDAARARLRAAATAFAEAEKELNAAAQNLYDVWQTQFGSERWLARQFDDDRAVIYTQAGLRR